MCAAANQWGSRLTSEELLSVFGPPVGGHVLGDLIDGMGRATFEAGVSASAPELIQSSTYIPETERRKHKARRKLKRARETCRDPEEENLAGSDEDPDQHRNKRLATAIAQMKQFKNS